MTAWRVYVTIIHNASFSMPRKSSCISLPHLPPQIRINCSPGYEVTQKETANSNTNQLRTKKQQKTMFEVKIFRMLFTHCSCGRLFALSSSCCCDPTMFIASMSIINHSPMRSYKLIHSVSDKAKKTNIRILRKSLFYKKLVSLFVNW